MKQEDRSPKLVQPESCGNAPSQSDLSVLFASVPGELETSTHEAFCKRGGSNVLPPAHTSALPSCGFLHAPLSFASSTRHIARLVSSTCLVASSQYRRGVSVPHCSASGRGCPAAHQIAVDHVCDLRRGFHVAWTVSPRIPSSKPVGKRDAVSLTAERCWLES